MVGDGSDFFCGGGGEADETRPLINALFGRESLGLDLNTFAQSPHLCSRERWEAIGVVCGSEDRRLGYMATTAYTYAGLSIHDISREVMLEEDYLNAGLLNPIPRLGLQSMRATCSFPHPPPRVGARSKSIDRSLRISSPTIYLLLSRVTLTME